MIIVFRKEDGIIMKKLISVCLLVFMFFGMFLFGFYSNTQNETRYIYITIKETQIIEVPVIQEKEKIVLYFDKSAYSNTDNDVYHQPTQTPFTVTDEYMRSGVWSEIPFDHDKNGTIECKDFMYDYPGLDRLLDLAYNRYGLKYLDGDGNGVPCDEKFSQ